MQMPWYIQHWTGLKDVASLAVVIVSAWVGLLTYVRSVRTRRADSLVALHKGFFVDRTYDDVRKELDADTEEEKLRRDALVLPLGPSEALINFLNWFELIAYLQEIGIYKEKDIKALFGYYLRLLKHSGPVYTYICDSKSDFQHLKELLGKLPS